MARFAIGQINSKSDVVHNMSTIEELAESANKQGADILVLPEMCLSLDHNHYRQFATDNQYYDFFAKLAIRYHLWIIVGALPQLAQNTSDKLRSSLLIFDDQGVCRARYDKRHLFDVTLEDDQANYQESRFFSAGEQVSSIETPFGCLGLSICFDIRFPQHFRELRRQGADILIVPAAFTYLTGQAHWEVLLRARAIEQQCFVVAANQCGWHDERRQTWGHSMVINPWGDIINALGHEPAVLCVDIDIAEVHKVRQAMPLVHR